LDGVGRGDTIVFNLCGDGFVRIVVDAGALSLGTYSYYIIIKVKAIDGKTMVITE
jgi:hypothetical protein